MPVERLDVTTSTDRLQVALHQARYDFALAHTTDATAILEIGAGCGELAEKLSRLPSSYVGVEIDHATAEQARGRLGGTGRIIEADARELPFGNGEFSHIICLEVLEHLGNYRPAIEHIRRCLRPEGRAIISVPYRRRGGKSAENPYHPYEPGEAELVAAFRDAFHEVKVFYQYYEESWWMTLARVLHLRRLLGLAEPYRLLSEGHPSQLARLRLGPEARGMKQILVLLAQNPRSSISTAQP